MTGERGESRYKNPKPRCPKCAVALVKQWLRKGNTHKVSGDFKCPICGGTLIAEGNKRLTIKDTGAMAHGDQK